MTVLIIVWSKPRKKSDKMCALFTFNLQSYFLKQTSSDQRVDYYSTGWLDPVFDPGFDPVFDPGFDPVFDPGFHPGFDHTSL